MVKAADPPICPVCDHAVAVGVQCSLCLRWFHLASGLPGAPPAARAGAASDDGEADGDAESLARSEAASKSGTSSSSASVADRRAGCVPIPYLLPMFCTTCVAHTTTARMELSLNVAGSPTAFTRNINAGAAPFAEDDDNDDEQPAAASMERHELDDALQEISSKSDVKRAARAEVQQRWNRLFSQRLLRRLRKFLSASGREALYRERRAERDVRQEHADDSAVILPAIDAGVRMTTDDDGTRKVADILGAADHLDGLHASRKAMLAQQRKRWVGQTLDYSSAAAGAPGAPARGGAEPFAQAPPATPKGGGNPKPPTHAPHPSTNPYFQQNSAMRLSHVVIDVGEETDDDDGDGGSAPPSRRASLSRKPSGPW
jgi:hypothetical protein